MDYGHYNCRDYHIQPHLSPTTITSLPRHESFQDLEFRSRSPSSQAPKFPLLRLPLELRQQILRYLLPYTREFRDSGLLTSHARNFSAVKKRQAKGMVVPTTNAAAPQEKVNGNGGAGAGVANIVWHRGLTNLLCVSQQLHSECSELLYGTNTFLLFVTYSGIKFRFRWLLPSGLAPSRSYDFLELMPEKYLRLVKRVVVHVDHVDPYMGMIKFNVQGRGLAVGLRERIQVLVDALRLSEGDLVASEEGVGQDGVGKMERRLAKVDIRVSNGSAVIESLKSDAVRQREDEGKVNDDVEEMLAPFGQLRGVRDVSIAGAVPKEMIEKLNKSMKSMESADDVDDRKLVHGVKALAKDKPAVQSRYGFRKISSN